MSDKVPLLLDIPISLGDHKDDIRSRFTVRSFRRTPNGREVDQIPSIGCLATYGTDERVSMLELVAPSRPTVGGFELLGRSLTEVVHDLRALGMVVEEDSIGAATQSFCLYAPSGMIEGVSVGE